MIELHKYISVFLSVLMIANSSVAAFATETENVPTQEEYVNIIETTSPGFMDLEVYDELPDEPVIEETSALAWDEDENITQETTSENVAIEIAIAHDGSCGDRLTWSFDANSGTLIVQGSGNMTDFGYDGQPWNEYVSIIQKIIISNGVTSVGSYAFSHCTNLKSISIPNSVTEIGKYAFYHCSALESISLPENLKSLSQAVFNSCVSLKSISIPVGVTAIGSYVFENCTSLESVNISGTVSSIGTTAFANCVNLTSITLPESLTELGGGCFYGCTNLSSITIPAGVTRLQDHMFYGCASLTSITIPSKIASIEHYVFGECYELRTITFEGNAPQIDDVAFYGIYNVIAYYPSRNVTWTEDVFRDYGGQITWREKTVTSEPNLRVPQKPYKITNVVSGIRIYWNAGSGISKYGIWRSVDGKNGPYKLIATTSATNYLDTQANSGKLYYYRLTSIDQSGTHSEKSESIGKTFIGTPDLTLRVNRAVGIGLSWNEIKGATGYAIYRKTPNSLRGWVRVATINDPHTISWNDTSVRNNNGTIYKYTVRALGGSDLSILSGCYGNGKTMVRLTSQTVKSAEKVGSGSIRCTWSANSQAHGYEVRFISDEGQQKTITIGNVETTSRTISGFLSNEQYKIQVRSYKKVNGIGTFYSAWSVAKYVSMD